MSKSKNNAEQNLIFAGLGLQLGMLSKEQVIRAFTEWLFDKSKPLSQILLSQKAMAQDKIKTLELAVEGYIQKEGGHEKTLATLHIVKDLESNLDHLGDQDLHATLDIAIVQRKQLGLDEQFTKSQLSDVSEKMNPFVSPSEGVTTKDRFERQQFFDAGNLGELYFAKDIELNRTVVVKYIKPERANESLTQALFHLEGEVTGVLEHPSIVPVYGLGKDSKGRLFYAMRYIRGRKLSRVISEYHAIPKTESGTRKEALVGLLQNFQAACLAIEYAHMKRVLHCDIKPDNIMIGDYGEVFVVDWGLVIVYGEEAVTHTGNEDAFATLEVGQIPPYRPSGTASSGLHRNQGGSRRGVGGTPAYMAPEQIRATFDEDVTHLDHRADIYALGGVLFQILTGKPPHLSKKIAKESMGDFQKRILSGDFPRPRDLNRDIPKPLESIALKALSLKPEKRYGFARELAEDVKRWLADEPVQAFKEGWVDKIQRIARKNRTLVAADGLFFVFLALGSLGYIMITQGYNEKLRVSEKTALASAAAALGYQAKAEANEKTALANAEEAKNQTNKALANEKLATEAQKATEKLLYISNIQKSYSEWKNGEVNTPLDQLPKIPFSQRGWEHDFLNTLTTSDQVSVLGHFWGHYVTCAFSPDGKKIARGGTEILMIIDAATGAEITRLYGHTGHITSVAFSPDGKHVVSVSDDKTAKVWDLTSGKEISTFTGHVGRVWHVAFSPDGKHVVSVSDDKTAKVWDSTSGKEICNFTGHVGPVYGVAFSPDGKQIASGSWDNTAKVWDSTSGKEICNFTAHRRPVVCVAFSPDGKQIASGSLDKTVKVWDSTSGKETRTIQHSFLYGLTSVAFSPDGRQIATGSEDGTIKVFDTASGLETTTLKGHKAIILSVSFSPDGGRIASGSKDGHLKIWDVTSFQKAITFGGGLGVVWIEWSPDNKRLYLACWGSTIRIWDLVSNREIGIMKGHSNTVNSLALSLDGKRIVSGSADQTIKIWNLDSGLEVNTLRGHTADVICVGFSPDGKRIVSCSRDKTIMIWDYTTGNKLQTLVGHQGPISRAFFSPDGNTICSCSEDDTIKLWDASTGREIFTLKGHKGFVYSACFSPDGKKIASGSWDQTIKLWDVHSGLETNTLKGHMEPVKHVAFSPDGKRIVSGSWGRIVKVWDTASGLELLSLSGHSDEILYACFSPDGKKIASSGGGDSTVRIWDASNTMELSILGHREWLRNVAISPDGKFIFSEDDQGNKKFWKTENGKELPFSEAIKIKEHFINNSTVSQDNEWSVEIQGTEARLVNNKLRQERIARDKENLARWATPNPNWHLAQAIESEKNNQWFAATFHLKKLLEFESYKEDATKRLASIEKKANAN